MPTNQHMRPSNFSCSSLWRPKNHSIFCLKGQAAAWGSCSVFMNTAWLCAVTERPMLIRDAVHPFMHAQAGMVKAAQAGIEDGRWHCWPNSSFSSEGTNTSKPVNRGNATVSHLYPHGWCPDAFNSRAYRPLTRQASKAKTSFTSAYRSLSASAALSPGSSHPSVAISMAR